MPSVLALRALLGAGLGLGALDLVWINVALAPRLVSHDHPQPVAHLEPAPQEMPIIEPPAPAPIVEEPKPPEPLARTVYFETGSAELSDSARKTLAELVAQVPEGSELVAEGHADPRGTELLNKTLSKDRATAVQQALVRLGVARARIRVTYMGASSDATELWRERRVDIQIIGGTR